MDTYVYTKNVSLNDAYISGEMEKLGLTEFEQSNRQLAEKLFGGESLTEKEQEQLNYMLSSGTYGTFQQGIENKLRKNNWSKLDYMVHRFLVPVRKNIKEYAIYAETYPLFYKYKILLPLLPFYRTIRSMKNGRFTAERKALKRAGR